MAGGLPQQYSDQDLIDILKDYYQTHGFPTQRAFTKKNGLPSSGTYFKRFGSFSNAVALAGIKVSEDRQRYFDREAHTDEELLSMLSTLITEHLEHNMYLPTGEDINNSSSLPSINTYEKHFNGLNNAYKQLGYDVDEFNRKAMEQDMIKEYKVFKELLGHVPSSREVTKYSASGHGYSTQAYLDHFGSLSNLQQLCGYLPTRIGRTKTRDDLLSDLKQLGDELGRTPSVYDLKGRDDLASLSMYQREFGSFADALKLIGYKPNLKIITTNKGNKCLSYLEYKFTKMLEHFGLKFKREVRYSDYIDFDRQYRFDYVVDVNGKEVFVEIFGIIKNEKYANRKQEKIMLCKQNGLPLVAYERKDLWNTSNQKLYDDFLHRAEQVLQVVSECDN